MCSGARAYSRFGTRGLNMLEGMRRWIIEVRYHSDDSLRHTYLPGGVERSEAETVEQNMKAFLDHELFYMDIVELPS